MGSQWESDMFFYREGQLRQYWDSHCEDVMYEYGHRYDAGTIAHKGGYPRMLGRLPSRMSAYEFETVADRFDTWQQTGKWRSWDNDGTVHHHRRNPVPKHLQKDTVFMNLLNAYLHVMKDSGKWDNEYFCVRLNPQQEKHMKEVLGKKGTQLRVAFVAGWVPS